MPNAGVTNKDVPNDDSMNDTFIELLSDMIIQSNTESREHMWFVERYSSILSRYYSKLYPRSRMSSKKQKLIANAARIHDVGKISMPDVLLTKMGTMSFNEFNLYKKHTIKGSQIIRSFSVGRDRDFERICYNVCLYHHEKYDGSGYPYGLKADKIPVEAQIVGLADIYDTLRHGGVPEPVSDNKAFYMIVNGKCGKISERLINCFEEAREELEAVDISMMRGAG
jgi:putative two-component system response regulator